MALETSILDAYAVADDVFHRRPAVTFLAKTYGEVVLTVFTTAFTPGRETVPDDQLRSHVGNVLGTLRDAGHSIPSASARELCAQWVAEGWLFYDTQPDGTGVYFLTSASKDTIAWTTGLANRRMVSATRVSTILEAIESMAELVDPDRASAIARLEARIREQTAQLRRLRKGAQLEEATLDEFVQRFDHISHLMASIPADFRSVAESFTAAKRRIFELLLTGQDPAGGIMAQASGDALGVIRGTQSGKAFEGVVDLLRDSSTVAELRGNITRIMAHEFADGLTASERATFADITAVFTGNVEAVLDGPRKISVAVHGALERHVGRGDSRSGVDEAIRAARAGLLAYQGRTIPAGVVPTVARVDMPRMIQRLHDPRPVPPPVRLMDVPVSDATPVSEEEVRRWGGPHVTAIRDHVARVLADETGEVGLAAIWEAAPADLRRAVELVAYFDVAHRRPGTTYAMDSCDRVRTLAPDGTVRDVEIPLVLMRREEGDHE
ncbi:DUF3375 family protein [Kribbella sp. NPDC006257]|uniref:DUF3375 family protein n=1 Tax=Kribbella sp. NPDC006257 TaxID=3156738 RepID=UPI0033BB5B04